MQSSFGVNPNTSGELPHLLVSAGLPLKKLLSSFIAKSGLLFWNPMS